MLSPLQKNSASYNSRKQDNQAVCKCCVHHYLLKFELCLLAASEMAADKGADDLPKDSQTFLDVSMLFKLPFHPVYY